MPTASITDTQLIEAALRTFGDHRQLCANSLTIRKKSGETVPLLLTGPQQRVVDKVKSIRRRNKPVRLVILKGRQEFVSTVAASLIYRECAFLPGQHGLCMGDIYKTSGNLWSYYEQFQSSYRPFAGISQLTPERALKGKRISWAGDSYVDFGTAERDTSGRSFSIRHLHLSEYAFYGDAATLMTGLMQSVPDDPGTTVIVESTANGLGGEFYDLWMRSQDPQECGDWEFLFLTWLEHPEYTMPLDMPRDVFQRSMTPEEISLHQGFGATFEQLAWRRAKIKNACAGNVDTFHQEYPSYPEEAFLVSGRPVFDAAALARMPIDREPIVGRLKLTEDFPSQRIFLELAEKGELTVFRRPDRQRRYAIGIDTSRGIDRAEGGAGKTDPDYCVANVLDVDTGEQVASLRGRFSPKHWSEQLIVLGRWYNTAWLVPEANENGLAVIEYLTIGYPITQLYRRKPLPDQRGSINLNELGWWTDTRTRPQLINTLDTAIREGAVIIRKANTLQECRTFIYKPTGKSEGQAGCHDDEVLALALAVIGMCTAPKAQPNGPKPQPARAMTYAGRRRRGNRNEDED